MRNDSTSNLITLFKLLLQIVYFIITVNGHGRLMDPPSRNAMWRYGYPNPVNYNDNELFCGGYAVQWEQNSGRCGVCGDAYHMDSPRPHEAGGEYARGIISRVYTAGQEIEVEVELTANHYGRFEMFLCPNNDPRYEATQECFNRYPLYISGTREISYSIPNEARKQEIFRYRVRLPQYVTCTQCVIQWTYYTGNMWGTCPNGTEAVGCGNPETFRNCADVAIVSSSGGAVPPAFLGNKSPYLLHYRDYRAPSSNNIFPLIVRDPICSPTYEYRDAPGMQEWCQSNCVRDTSHCPKSVCRCSGGDGAFPGNQSPHFLHYRDYRASYNKYSLAVRDPICTPTYVYRDAPGMQEWCQSNCIRDTSHCPKSVCRCSGGHGAFPGNQSPHFLYYRDYRAPSSNNIFPLIIRDQICLPTYVYRDVPGMQEWCQSNCIRYPPNCPETVCHCPRTCEAIGHLRGVQGADVYCMDSCLNYRSRCPSDRCRCY